MKKSKIKKKHEKVTLTSRDSHLGRSKRYVCRVQNPQSARPTLGLPLLTVLVAIPCFRENVQNRARPSSSTNTHDLRDKPRFSSGGCYRSSTDEAAGAGRPAELMLRMHTRSMSNLVIASGSSRDSISGEAARKQKNQRKMKKLQRVKMAVMMSTKSFQRSVRYESTAKRLKQSSAHIDNMLREFAAC